MSIGADEYDADLADDYNNFVNEMASLCSARLMVVIDEGPTERVHVRL